MPATRMTVLLLAALAMFTTGTLAGEDSSTTASRNAPLSLDQVVDNLVRKNQERAQALLRYDATRVYHLTYRGFPGDREARQRDRKHQCAMHNNFYIFIFHRSSAPPQFTKCSEANFQTFPVQ